MSGGARRAESILALKRALVAGYPIIAIDAWEEDQVLVALQGLAGSLFGATPAITTWDLQHGLQQPGEPAARPASMLEALDAVAETQEPGFFICNDVVSSLTEPEVQRRLRTIHFAFRGHNRFLFLPGVEVHIPPTLSKDIHLLLFGFPDHTELHDIVTRALAGVQKRGATGELTDGQLGLAAGALRGFTAAEAQHALNKVLWGRKVIDESLLKDLQQEKEQIARKEGILEYVRTEHSIDDVGGLENLKAWLLKRQRLFSPEARTAGIRAPRGLLMMGISGCGKSLSVKAISALWNLPLFRLDMNQVYSGMFGTPEATFHRAIRSIEAVAPAILWIDEIEGGISSSTQKDGSTGSHIFSAFLTWMQEKSADVFVAATANRIDLLPAEVIRKGRFDQIFFLDLPNDHEREAIFRVHLRRRNIDPTGFDLPLLSVATENWNGAEIEHAVEAAHIEAFHRGAELAQDDLYTIIRATIPLARTMLEQIKFIKAWASERALSASVKD
jgi:AAA+ superfamily predicted ATPase